MIVEDGTGVADADAGISEAWLEAYAEARGLTIPSGDVEAAIVRGTTWVEAVYGYRFPGARKNGRSQGLSFPRTGGFDRNGYAIPDDAVPVEYMRAVAEATLRELASPASLAPDIVPVTSGGGAIKRMNLDGTGSIEYTEASTSGVTVPIFPLIDGILAPLIGRSGGSMIALLRA